MILVVSLKQLHNRKIYKGLFFQVVMENEIDRKDFLEFKEDKARAYILNNKIKQ